MGGDQVLFVLLFNVTDDVGQPLKVLLSTSHPDEIDLTERKKRQFLTIASVFLAFGSLFFSFSVSVARNLTVSLAAIVQLQEDIDDIMNSNNSNFYKGCLRDPGRLSEPF